MSPVRAPTEATVSRGIVVTAHPTATEAGYRTFAAGGNAIDAAAAAAWALCVCEPSGSGLGGQTVVLLRLGDGRTVVVDGHSCAPAGVSTKTVSRRQQRLGYRATTVPTTPATLSYVQRSYGALPAAQVLAPAIHSAEAGYTVSPLQHRQQRWCAGALAATRAASRFLQQGRPYLPGESFHQPELAGCLRRLADFGAEDFYRGRIAESIDADMRHHGGVLELSDLDRVGPPREREALAARYGDHLVLTIPGPGGGPQLLHALAVLEGLNDSGWRDRPNAWYQAVARAVHEAFDNREREHRRTPGRGQGAARVLSGAAGERGGETTHLCTADADGNVVSLTQSIQSLFGAKVANAEYGFLYNNYLTTCPRRSHAHGLAAGCPARSNAAPTFLVSLQNGAHLFALGAAGSRRIISALVQVSSGVLDLGVSLSEALARPRIHPVHGGKVLLERPAATPSLLAELADQFGAVEVRGRRSYAMGAVQALEVTEDSKMAGVADPRRDGTAQLW